MVSGPGQRSRDGTNGERVSATADDCMTHVTVTQLNRTHLLDPIPVIELLLQPSREPLLITQSTFFFP